MGNHDLWTEGQRPAKNPPPTPRPMDHLPSVPLSSEREWQNARRVVFGIKENTPTALPAGVWVVYDIVDHVNYAPFPLYLGKDELDAHHYVQKMGRFLRVKFWIFGEEWGTR